MNREVHVRICGRLGANFPGPTRQQETGPGQPGLRWRGESHVEYPPGDYSYCACSRLYSLLHVRREKALDFSGCNSRPGTGSLHPVATETTAEVTKRSELSV